MAREPPGYSGDEYGVSWVPLPLPDWLSVLWCSEIILSAPSSDLILFRDLFPYPHPSSAPGIH